MTKPGTETPHVLAHAAATIPYGVFRAHRELRTVGVGGDARTRGISGSSSLVSAGAGTAGLAGSGEASDVDARLISRGAAIGIYRAQQLTRDIADGADLILAMGPPPSLMDSGRMVGRSAQNTSPESRRSSIALRALFRFRRRSRPADAKATGSGPVGKMRSGIHSARDRKQPASRFPALRGAFRILLPRLEPWGSERAQYLRPGRG